MRSPSGPAGGCVRRTWYPIRSWLRCFPSPNARWFAFAIIEITARTQFVLSAGSPQSVDGWDTFHAWSPVSCRDSRRAIRVSFACISGGTSRIVAFPPRVPGGAGHGPETVVNAATGDQAAREPSASTAWTRQKYEAAGNVFARKGGATRVV